MFEKQKGKNKKVVHFKCVWVEIRTGVIRAVGVEEENLNLNERIMLKQGTKLMQMICKSSQACVCASACLTPDLCVWAAVALPWLFVDTPHTLLHRYT